jgi:surface antigen
LAILNEETNDETTINVNNILIDKNDEWLIYYIVQPWDSIWKIALNFWATTVHIKKINKLTSDTIKPWQKLIITDQPGFLYTYKWEKLSDLASKYWTTVDSILQANSIDDITYTFQKNDEIFIPVTEEQLAKLFPPKPTATTQTKPVYSAPQSTATPTNYSTSKTVVSKYRYNPNVSNWFYRWHCTRFVAMKKFPYESSTKQTKLWNWNANQWYANAKKAGYSVWQTPKIWSIVVIKYWWANYYSAWHVWIVKQIDRNKKKLLIEEMNALWKYVVTMRWINMDSKITWYIYL